MTTIPGAVRLLLATLAASLIAGCSAVDPQLNVDIAQRKVRIVATVGMVADVVRIVGGERVQVKGLMGPGVDPHLYKASEGDVLALGQADVIFYAGLHLEAGMTRVLERMKESDRLAVAVTRSIDRARLSAPPEFAGQYDPHVWFDVSMWLQTVDVIRDTLIATDPGSSALYGANAERYRAELAQLHSYVQQQVERIPPQQRVLVTAHDAFSYFGRAYGFEVIGLQGISTEAEASTADVQRLTDLIIRRQVPAVFIESSVPQRTIEAVQAAVRARGHSVRVGGELFSDAMGRQGTVEGTYIGMVTHNIDTIVAALSR